MSPKSEKRVHGSAAAGIGYANHPKTGRPARVIMIATARKVS